MDERDTNSPFGVLAFLDWNHPWNGHMYNSPLKTARAVDSMAEAGVKMVRQVISWDEVERTEGRFDFAQYDVILDELERKDIRMLGVLGYTALWTGREWNAAPDPALFILYVRQTVRRYKDRVKYWEVWNEPDHPTYWQPQDGMKTYVLLLKKVYSAIKEEDPTAVVVLGSVNSSPNLSAMYRHGAKRFFDIVNLHPFVSPLALNALEKVRENYTSVREVMSGAGDQDKPIWFTEMGCPGVRDPERSKGWWQGQSPTQQQQADWVSTIYREGLRWPGVQRIFWAFLQETRHFGDDSDAFGLISHDFTRKPAFKAYRRAAETWTSVQKLILQPANGSRRKR